MQSKSRLSLPRNRSHYEHACKSSQIRSHRPRVRHWEYFNMAEFFVYVAFRERDPILRAGLIASGKAAVRTSRLIRLSN